MTLDVNAPGEGEPFRAWDTIHARTRRRGFIGIKVAVKGLAGNAVTPPTKTVTVSIVRPPGA